MAQEDNLFDVNNLEFERIEVGTNGLELQGMSGETSDKEKTPKDKEKDFAFDPNELLEDQDKKPPAGEPSEEEQQGSGDTKDTTLAKDSKESASSSSPFMKTLAQALYEEGIITNEIKEEDNFESAIDVINLIKQEIDNQSEKFKSSYKEEIGSKAAKLAEALENGANVDLVKDLLSKESNLTNITDDQLEDFDDSSIQLRKGLLNEYYKNVTSFDDDEIEKMIDNLVDSGEDVKMAKKAKTKLLSIYNEKQQAEIQANQEEQQKFQKQQEDYLKQLKDNINGLEEILPGIKATPKLKERLYDMQTKVVKTDKDSGTNYNAIGVKRSEDPLHFDMKLAALIELGAFDKDGQEFLNKLKVKTKSNALKELEKQTQSGNIMGHSGRANRSQGSSFDFSGPVPDEIFSRKHK